MRAAKKRMIYTNTFRPPFSVLEKSMEVVANQRYTFFFDFFHRVANQTIDVEKKDLMESVDTCFLLEVEVSALKTITTPDYANKKLLGICGTKKYHVQDGSEVVDMYILSVDQKVKRAEKFVGLGSRLFEYVMNKFKNKKMTIVSGSEKYVQDFYKKRGFRQCPPFLYKGIPQERQIRRIKSHWKNAILQINVEWQQQLIKEIVEKNPSHYKKVDENTYIDVFPEGKLSNYKDEISIFRHPERAIEGKEKDVEEEEEEEEIAYKRDAYLESLRPYHVKKKTPRRRKKKKQRFDGMEDWDSLPEKELMEYFNRIFEQRKPDEVRDGMDNWNYISNERMERYIEDLNMCDKSKSTELNSYQEEPKLLYYKKKLKYLKGKVEIEGRKALDESRRLRKNAKKTLQC